MKVKEAITALLECDPEEELCCYVSEGYGYFPVKAVCGGETNHGTAMTVLDTD